MRPAFEPRPWLYFTNLTAASQPQGRLRLCVANQARGAENSRGGQKSNAGWRQRQQRHELGAGTGGKGRELQQLEHWWRQ